MNINSNMESIEKFTDVQLVSLVKQEKEYAFNELVFRYIPLIKSKASVYYKLNVDPEDLLQEGLLGLFNATKNYDESVGASFKTYAGICIERRLLSVYRSTLRQKHVPIEKIVSIDDESIAKISSCLNEDPEDFFIKYEDYKLKKEYIKKNLSDLEFKVLSMYISGYTYNDISKELKVGNKVVDNALQRIRKKLKD